MAAEDPADAHRGAAAQGPAEPGDPAEPDVTVRLAVPEDGAAIAAMAGQRYIEEGMPAPNFTGDAFRRDGFGAAPAFRAALAEVAGQPVGYVLFGATYDVQTATPGVVVIDIFVARPVRQHSVGRRLIAAAARHGAGTGAAWLTLTVWQRNAEAAAFMRHLGGAEYQVDTYVFHDAMFQTLLEDGTDRL